MGRIATGSHTGLAARARRQHGLFTLEQALTLGFTRSYVRRRLRERMWHEVEPRVYRAKPTAPMTWLQELMARVLATGGVASGRSAAALFGLLPQPRVVEVLVARGARSARHRCEGVHSFEHLDPRDVTTVAGVPTTAPALTLIVLGNSAAPELLADIVDTAIVQRLVTPRRLAERATALWAPRRRGCAAVLDHLSTRHPELWRARNQWEARVLRLFRTAALPDPIPNHAVIVDGQRRVLDFAWPDRMVAVEFDGFVPHTTRRVFDDDRERQNLIVDAGWRVYRLTATSVRRRARPSIAPITRAVVGNR
jgi:very-short-patch-repair endonuclease